MKKVYVVGPSVGYSRFIPDRVMVDDIRQADVVVFTGGEDVNPNLYGKKAHHTSYWTPSRDKYEVEAWKAMRPGQLAVGICRGAQLFCALYGGILVQDCNHHCGTRHNITNGSETYQITSIHHQMLYPWDLDKGDYEVLFWSEGLSDYYSGDGVDPDVVRKNGEPEIVLFHREGLPMALGIQGHPEMMAGSPVANKINEIIDSLLVHDN